MRYLSAMFTHRELQARPLCVELGGPGHDSSRDVASVVQGFPILTGWRKLAVHREGIADATAAAWRPMPVPSVELDRWTPGSCIAVRADGLPTLPPSGASRARSDVLAAAGGAAEELTEGKPSPEDPTQGWAALEMSGAQVWDRRCVPSLVSTTTKLQGAGPPWSESRATRRRACAFLARSLRNCVSSSQASSCSGVQRSRGSNSRTAR